jgi:hypothetical protein
MKEIVKLIILSHKRANKVDTLETISNCSLCIPESQVADYEKYNQGVEMIVHPDTIKGLSAKMRWVHERYPNCVMLDDDLNRMSRTFVDKEFDEKVKVDRDTAYDVIQSTAFTAREAGCKMFGFSNSARPVDYTPMKPYKLTGFAIGGSMGFFEGFKMLLPDECVSACDFFVSGLCAHFHRRCFINTRYAFTSKEGTFVSTGGMSEHRTMETEKRDYYLLKEYFGSVIKRKKSTSMRKTLANEYERILSIPF